MNNPLISIIIPIYNKQDQLPTTISSILKQQYKNLEIICIDDDSSDNSYEIIQKYATQDSRFKIYSLKNVHNVSKVRNFGIKQATGEYISFVDADDTINENFYADFIEKIEENIDIIKGTLNTIAGNFSQISNLNTLIKQNKKCFWGEFYSALFKKDFLIKNNLKFDEELFTWEDPHFIINTVKHTNRIAFCDNAIYNYYRNSTSLSHGATRKHIDCWVLSSKKILDLMSNEEDYKLILNNLVLYLYFVNKPNIKEQELKNYADNAFQEILNLKPEYSFERNLLILEKEWKNKKMKEMMEKIKKSKMSK